MNEQKLFEAISITAFNIIKLDKRLILRKVISQVISSFSIAVKSINSPLCWLIAARWAATLSGVRFLRPFASFAGRSRTRVCVIQAGRMPINCHPAAIGPLLAAIIGVINSSGGVQVVFTARPLRHSITDPRASRGGSVGSPAGPYRSPGPAPVLPPAPRLWWRPSPALRDGDYGATQGRAGEIPAQWCGETLGRAWDSP